MVKIRKMTAVLLSALMIMSGINVFAASGPSAGTGSDSEKDTFKVQSVLPDDQTVSVPVNTGIEITFSDRVSDIDSLFSVSPDVKGRFEKHGKTVVFVPEKELSYKTVYTVTLKAGVKNAAKNAATTEGLSLIHI